MIELDVRATADGRCVVIHDATVERTTDGTGAVAAMTFERLRELDAGYRFSDEAGRQPFRGQRIPTIEEVFEELPHTRLTVEVKDGAAQRPLFDAIERFGASRRVIAAGMHATDRTLFSSYDGPLSASREELLPFFFLHKLGLARLGRIPADVIQVPEHRGRFRIVSPRFVRDVQAAGVHVHVWTINDEHDMDRLLDWGVNGLVTDRPDRLGLVLHRRNGRQLAAGHRAT